MGVTSRALSYGCIRAGYGRVAGRTKQAGLGVYSKPPTTRFWHSSAAAGKAMPEASVIKLDV